MPSLSDFSERPSCISECPSLRSCRYVWLENQAADVARRYEIEGPDEDQNVHWGIRLTFINTIRAGDKSANGITILGAMQKCIISERPDLFPPRAATVSNDKSTVELSRVLEEKSEEGQVYILVTQ
nr:hypothetical protein CFP56_78790 [Quercus suber]